MPCVPKKIGDGPIKWLLLGRSENINEKQLWVQNPSLINRSIKDPFPI
jgi:hypothetical protein